ncbi:beta-fructofuranosidase, insoluble isoenzyme CWINV1-like [Cryptomeria japonica]|uniref:beta-fructofuranosidase, insoluble isoenzyme CWINV1-like n=1 Tax=Cryptomeria japonica TaxID=3369 RepID=UPI0027DA30F9|nr:beta-fructofuranosidase, insoluble isoenzyme CWINV1-like [Cryptomeria japonica]
MFYKGYYHLFYQYNPNGTIPGNIVWGHSVSQDLVNWRFLNATIIPSEWYDIGGCWSGSTTFLQDGKPVILYTGITNASEQVQNMAVPKNLSDPFLREWVKIPENPIIVPDGDMDGSNFRDPTTGWFESVDMKWRIVVGSLEGGSRGRALLYKSTNFIKWEKAKHPLHSSESSGMWECPDFYPVHISGKQGLDTSFVGPSVKHVMKVSLQARGHDYYTVGSYLVDEDIFVPDKGSQDDEIDLRYDYGKFYASKSFYDVSKNRRVLWGWIPESDSQSDDIMKGWAGLQGIPRTIWLDDSTKMNLIHWPVAEVESLRGKKTVKNNTVLKSGEVVEISGVTGAQVDVEVSFDLQRMEIAEFEEMNGTATAQELCSNIGVSHQGVVGPFGLFVLASKDLTQYTAVFYHLISHQNKLKLLMCSDQSRSSTLKDLDKTTYGSFVPLNNPKKIVSLRVLVDHSIVESFAEGGKSCITSRVYPTSTDLHLYLFNNGSSTILCSQLNAWDMNTTNNVY